VTKHSEANRKDTREREITVFIESSKASRNKYKFDKDSGGIKLSKLLPEGMVFPFDFGFVSGTKGEDGDPLDVLVLNDKPSFPGCQMDCRLIGVLKANHTEKGKRRRNDRIIATALKLIEASRAQEAAYPSYCRARDMDADRIIEKRDVVILGAVHGRS
jgi:inorganic pyrophosphatase